MPTTRLQHSAASALQQLKGNSAKAPPSKHTQPTKAGLKKAKTRAAKRETTKLVKPAKANRETTTRDKPAKANRAKPTVVDDNISRCKLPTKLRGPKTMATLLKWCLQAKTAAPNLVHKTVEELYEMNYTDLFQFYSSVSKQTPVDPQQQPTSKFEETDSLTMHMNNCVDPPPSSDDDHSTDSTNTTDPHAKETAKTSAASGRNPNLNIPRFCRLTKNGHSFDSDDSELSGDRGIADPTLTGMRHPDVELSLAEPNDTTAIKQTNPPNQARASSQDRDRPTSQPEHKMPPLQTSPPRQDNTYALSNKQNICGPRTLDKAINLYRECDDYTVPAPPGLITQQLSQITDFHNKFKKVLASHLAFEVVNVRPPRSVKTSISNCLKGKQLAEAKAFLVRLLGVPEDSKLFRDVYDQKHYYVVNACRKKYKNGTWQYKDNHFVGQKDGLFEMYRSILFSELGYKEFAPISN